MFRLPTWLSGQKRRPSSDRVLGRYNEIALATIPFDLSDLQRWRLHRGYINLIFFPILLCAILFAYTHAAMSSRPFVEAGIDCAIVVATAFFMMKYRRQLHKELTDILLIPAVVSSILKKSYGNEIRHALSLFFQQDGKDVTIQVTGPALFRLKNLDHVVIVADNSKKDFRAIGYVRVESMNSLRSPYVTCHHQRRIDFPFKKTKLV